MVPAPKEFLDFCSLLHQDLFLYGPEPRDWVVGALRDMRREKRSTLKTFIDGLLAGGYSDAELQAIYRSTDTELRIWNDEGVRPFLILVRDTINDLASS
jgi:hypothetical protein